MAVPCDYGHKERAGGAAVVIEHNCKIISKDIIVDLHTTEFRMMLTLMVKVMNELPEGSDILFLSNAVYIQNFDKEATVKSANPDLIAQCIEPKQRHNSVSVKIVQYHKIVLSCKKIDSAQSLYTVYREFFFHFSCMVRKKFVPLHQQSCYSGAGNGAWLANQGLATNGLICDE